MKVGQINNRALPPLRASYFQPAQTKDQYLQKSGWAQELPRWSTEAGNYSLTPALDGQVWLERQGDRPFRVLLGHDFEIRQIKEAPEHTYVAGQDELLCIDSNGEIMSRRKLEERPNHLALDRQGRLVVAGDSEVQILSPKLKPLHRLETGYFPRTLSVLEDNSVVVSGRPDRGERQLHVFDSEGNTVFHREGVDSGSVRTDGQRVYYLEGFINGTTRVYDSARQNDRLVSSSIPGGRLHPLGGGDYVALHHSPYTNTKKFEIHREAGSDSTFSLGYSEDVKAGFVDDAQNVYALSREHGRYQFFRLPVEEKKSFNPFTPFWMMSNPWVGESMETLHKSEDPFDPVVFRQGGFAILSRTGARLVRGEDEFNYDSVQELVNHHPELMTEPVASDSFGLRRRVEEADFGDHLSYWASQRNLELNLPEEAGNLVPAEGVPKVALPSHDHLTNFTDVPELPGVEPAQVSFTQPLAGGQRLVGTYQGAVYWVTPERVHHFQMKDEAAVGVAFEGERVLVGGSLGGVLEIEAGLRPQPEVDPDTTVEHLEDALRVGDFELSYT